MQGGPRYRMEEGVGQARQPAARSSSSSGQPGAAEAASAAHTSIEYTAEAEADRVRSLPGWGPLAPPLALFSGYVTVDVAAGRAVFYVLVESSHNVSKDPLLLWLNG